jgi:hypothetical protein
MPVRRQQALLAVIMLGVLLASVAIAAVLVAHSRRASRAAVRILGEIRSKGLKEFWSSEPVDTWLIGRDANGHAVRWRRTGRAARGDGYVGTEAGGDANGRFGTAVWSLNADATTGEYRAIDGREVTSISLADGMVALVSSSAGQLPPTPAPPDYIPEGTLTLLVHLATVRDEGIRARTIFDSRAAADEVVLFSSVRIEPRGPLSATETALGAMRNDYTFDKAGRVEKLTTTSPGGTFVYSPSTRAEVEATFRYVPRVRWMDFDPANNVDQGVPEDGAGEETPAADWGEGEGIQLL